MKVKSTKACGTIEPETYWQAGEIKEVENSLGKKLITNLNFKAIADEGVAAKKGNKKI